MSTTRNRRLLPLLAVALLVAAGQAGAAEVVNDIYLVAGPVTGGLTMPDATVVPAWGFGLEPDNDFTTLEAVPSVPGPTLAVPAIDQTLDTTTLNIHLYNNLTVPVSVVIPGQIQAGVVARIPETDVDYPAPAGTGGRIRSFAPETQPGMIGVYSWTGFRPGTFLYKSGTHQQVQVPMGLYGAVKQDYSACVDVNPDPLITLLECGVYSGVTYNNEVVVVYSALDPVLNNAVVTPGAYGPAGTIMTSTLKSNPLYFLVNGRPYSTAAPIIFTEPVVGQTTLLRFVNASSDTMVPTIYDEDVQVVAEYGHPYPFPFTQYSVDLAAGMTRDALFLPVRGGTYPVIDRTLHLTNAAAPDGGWIFKLAVVGDPLKPVATADAYATTEDTASFPSPVSVLANDVAGTGGPITAATLVQDVLHGTLSLLPDGTFTYTPVADYFGADFFLYTATDGINVSEPAAAVIRIDPLNDPPIAVDDVLAVFEDLPLTVPAPGVLANDVDVDGDALTAVLISLPSNGTVSLLGTGALTYTPNLNYFGPDSFQYEVHDATTSGGIATVNVNVASVDDVPVAVADVLPFVPANATYNLPAPGLLGNDWDIEGDPLTVVTTPVFIPMHGALTLSLDGSLSYTPDPGYVGTDYFLYKVNDGLLNSLAVHAWIYVNPVFYNGFEGGVLGGWTTVVP